MWTLGWVLVILLLGVWQDLPATLACRVDGVPATAEVVEQGTGNGPKFVRVRYTVGEDTYAATLRSSLPLPAVGKGLSVYYVRHRPETICQAPLSPLESFLVAPLWLSLPLLWYVASKYWLQGWLRSGRPSERNVRPTRAPSPR